MKKRHFHPLSSFELSEPCVASFFNLADADRSYQIEYDKYRRVWAVKFWKAMLAMKRKCYEQPIYVVMGFDYFYRLFYVLA